MGQANFLVRLFQSIPSRNFTRISRIPFNLRRNKFFMHDGALPHFARTVREYLNKQFACHFFIYGALKIQVYEVKINNSEQLWNRIRNAVNALRKTT